MSAREVTLEGGSPWGFRMHGGVDVHQPLRISRVNPGSKASLKGVREGDLITSINGRSTKEITNSEAHTLLKSAGDRLVLGLNEDCQNSPKRRQYKTILHHHRQEVVHESSKTSTSTSHTTLITTNDSKSSNSEPQQERTNFHNDGDEREQRDTVDGELLLPKTNGTFEIKEVSEADLEDINNVKPNGLQKRDTNPFRQATIDIETGEHDNESEYETDAQQEVDETPCVSTATPTPTTAATPTLTPTSSHYSSDTRGVGELVHVLPTHFRVSDCDQFTNREEVEHSEMPQRKKNKHKKNKRNASTKPTPANNVQDKSNENQNQNQSTGIPELDRTSQGECSSLSRKSKIEFKAFDKTVHHIEIEEITPSISTSSSSNSCENVQNYRVDSPKTVHKVKGNNKKETNDNFAIAKSKSLDDLDVENIKIIELKSGDELSDDDIKVRPCNEASISEADSDVDWELAKDLKLEDTESKNCSTSKLSSQEEEQLRYFIDKLNLPGTTGARVDEEGRSKVARSSSAIRQKRKEHNQLLQYFPPMYDNLRFLEAITEENCEQSEKDMAGKSMPKEARSAYGNEEIVNVVAINTKVERGECEVVVLDSSSGDDEESEESEELGVNGTDEEHKTPPPTPEKLFVSISEDESKDNSDGGLPNSADNDLKEEDNAANDKTEEDIKNSTDVPKADSPQEFIEQIIKDIVIKEEVQESTKNVQTFEIKVKKIYNDESKPEQTNPQSKPKVEKNEAKLHSANGFDKEKSESLDAEIAVVEQKILQTELNIAHDQKLIDQLQNSLVNDQKEILEAHEEIEHMKSFEKEFKEVLQQKQSFSPQRGNKERSTSRSSDSSNSSIGTTVVLNPSLKDMAAISAEAEAAEKNAQIQAKLANATADENQSSVGEIFENTPLSLKETCLKRLVELPFGADALEELAAVSSSLKEFTESLPEVAYSLISSKAESSKTFNSNIVTETSSKQEEVLSKVVEDTEGIKVVTNKSKEEHQLIVNESETVNEEVVVQKIVDISGSKKLLDIVIQEKLTNPELVTKETMVPDNLEELRQLHEARLNAKDKSEWLELVRTCPTAYKLPAVPKGQLPREAENWVDSKNFSKPRTPPERPPRRRRSLPPELHVKQMQYLIEKEKQIQAQLETLEFEKRKLINRMLTPQPEDRTRQRVKSLPPHEELRQRMYEEYQRQLAEREKRRSQKVIKISLNENDEVCSPVKSADFNDIEKEFMDIVKERKRHQNGTDSRETSAEKSDNDTVLVLDGAELRAKKVPKHLQEFLTTALPSKQKTPENEEFNEEFDESGSGCENGHDDVDGIWSPGQKSSFDRAELQRESTQLTSQESLRSNEDSTVVASVWTPKSAGSSPIAERKEFRPVNFESPVLQRKNRTKSDGSANAEPPWNKDVNSSAGDKKLPSSHSAPGPGFGSDLAPRLPKAQNPTITLLQKAREGQIPPKSATYIEQDRARRKNESPYNSQNDLIYNLRTESISDSDSERPKRKVYHQVRQPYEGIGPTTTHGMPVGLRSEIRDANMSQWYKRMYDTIHKHRPSKYDDEEYVTIRYKQRNRARHPFSSGGYLSEPEPGAYDSDVALSDDKYATLDRRRGNPYGGSSSNVAFQADPTQNSVYNRYTSYSTSTLPNTASQKPKSVLKPASTSFKRDGETTTIRYKPESQQTQSTLSLNRPGKIENYTPGKSSISESEAKKWWDEVMDIFDGWLQDHSAITRQRVQLNHDLREHISRQSAMEKQQQLQQQRQKVPLVQPKGYLSQALKESGYESDSTLVFRRRDETAQQLSPHEQREVYKNIQKGGDVPLHGLRKTVPDRPKEELVYSSSPPLNKLRVHRSAEGRVRSRSSSKEKGPILCYPLLTTFDNDTFAAYKRTAPSSTKPITVTSETSRRSTAIKPPNPPRRKSSRNNSTLRMIHTGRSTKPTKSCSPVSSTSTNRHETCFSPIPKSSVNVKTLREKITTKLSPVLGTTPGKSQKIIKTDVKKLRAPPLVKCYCTKSRPCGKCNVENEKAPKSPVEVKKAVMKQISAMNGNSSSAILAKINGTRKASPKKLTANNKKASALSPTLSTSIGSSRSTLKSASLDSLKSIKPKVSKTKIITKVGSKPQITKDTLEKKVLKKSKSKKELINSQVKSSASSGRQNLVEGNKNFKEKAAYAPKPTELVQHQPDGFFQQLFFGPQYIPKSSSDITPIISAMASKISNETRRICDPTIGALKRYLSHTKPVSESRFKYLDMVRSRSSSPKSITWTRDSSHERSISLPPKLIFTQTSRPVTPTFERKKLSIYKAPESCQLSEPRIEKLIFSQTSRPVSPVVMRRSATPNSIDGSWISSRCPSPSETLYFTETSRPVSPVVSQRAPPLPRRPVSPVYYPPDSPRSIRSPSYRRIKQKRSRPHSTEIMTCRSERFRELNKFYQDLERVDQLERTYSSSDLRPRRKFEEDIIDYDRWQEVRQRERAERELTSLYRQLKQTQEEHDFLFRSKPLCKWRRNLDRGLRIKERSVENLRDEFEKIRKDQLENERKLKEELNVKRGIYKSHWRGNSVVNLAHAMNGSQRSQSESRASVRQRICDNEKLLTHGIGSRIWSSLSLEQVNILKNQLTEIYGGDNRFSNRTAKPALSLPRTNTIEVSLDHSKPPKGLKVRRNSDTSPPNEQKVYRHIEKSKSTTSFGKVLSEDEKKKISQSLSKEILNLHFRLRDNVIKAKETLGAVAAANAQLPEATRNCHSLEISADENRKSDYLLVLSKNDHKSYQESINGSVDVWSRAKPVEPAVKTDCVEMKHPKSETESTSTDGSTKTVIYNDKMEKDKSGVKKEKIQEKVIYFENKDKEEYTPTIYKPSDEPVDEYGDTLVVKSSLPRSQSNQDLRELFGESQLNRIATEPLSASRKSKYTRPRSPVLRSLYHRARSLSPDAQYPHQKAIKVTDLKNKFEHYYNQRFTLPPRRCASDPQLSKLFHDGEKVTELRTKFEYPKITGRGRSRVRKSGLISSSCLKAEDRYMPHINIISKIATLYPKTHRNETSRSNENLAKILGIPVGEVHKLRERFDAADKQMSILGHMFTSSPNINELRDVAQYLTGNWYAHKHPKAEESDVIPKVLVRPKSASPPRQKSKLSSILKLPTRRRPAGSSTDEPEGPPPPPPSIEHDEVRTEVNDNNINVDLLTESPRKYVENEVTIHYRTPVRQEVKEAVDEHVLARQQADAMRKIYEQDRQRKYQQVSSYSDNELLDRRSRRHTDNFIPSQKSPIPLNRYDDFVEEMSSRLKARPRSPEPRLVARALYNFVGQSARELTFKKGDVIYVRRQIDKNWYEGELNAMIGLFPANYVEIVPYDGVKTTARKPNEGQARAKYNFIAQSHLELSLAKGELVAVTRRVDDNWYEGRIGGRKGIFPVSYVEILVDPQEGAPPISTKPVASPAAHSLLLNGSAGGKESMGTHNYVPTFPTQDLGMSYRAKPVQITDAGTYGSLKKNPIDQALHIDIQNDPVPYKALYKYAPQNEDELELLEGDVVQVLEKCDDGWFVGTSERTGAFGTFPGNYVEKIN